MKRKLLLFTLSAGIISLTLSSYGGGPTTGGAGNRTGSGTPAISNCNTGGCHAINNASVAVSVTLWDGLTPVTKYSVGKTYRVLVAATVPTTQTKFGFQLSSVKATSTTTQAGTLSIRAVAMAARRSMGPRTRGLRCD